MQGVGYYYRRRHGGERTTGSGTGNGGGGSQPPTFPTLTAAWGDRVVDVLSVNIHSTRTDMIYGTAGPYASPNAAMKASLDDIGIRHIRDAIAVAGSAATTQRAALAYLCVGGRDVNLLSSNLINQKTVTSAAAVSPTVDQVYNEVNAHYSGICASVEGLNESDLSGNASWVTVTRDYQSLLWTKFGPTGFTVLSPAMGNSSHMTSLGDVSAWCDAAAIHSYANTSPSIPIGGYITGTQTKNTGTKPIYLTETGYHTAINYQYPGATGYPPVTEAVQGVYAPVMLMEHYRRGLVRSFVYELGDDKPDATGAVKESHFGLFHNDWTRKPAGTSLKNLIALIADPGDAYTPAAVPMTVTATYTGNSDLRFVLVGKRDGTYALIIWRDQSVWTPGFRDSAGVWHDGVPVTVASQNVTVAFDQARTVKTYQPDNSASAASTVNATTHTVSLAGSLKVLTF